MSLYDVMLESMRRIEEGEFDAELPEKRLEHAYESLRVKNAGDGQSVTNGNSQPLQFAIDSYGSMVLMPLAQSGDIEKAKVNQMISLIHGQAKMQGSG